MLRLSLGTARGLVLSAQRLFAPPPCPATKQDLLDLIVALGCLQIDTISVVARTQYLVPWSRLGRYEPAWLDELLYPERATFEYWAHAASILPMVDFPYYRQDMLSWGQTGWLGNRLWAAEQAGLMEQVLETIRAAGPLSSSAFESRREGGSGAWGSWYGKESRRALEILWSMGELMVDRRRSGQKVYDLRERIVREHDGARLPSEEERDRFFTLRTARALGLVTPSWIADYFRRGWSKRKRQDLLEGLATAGLLVVAEVEGIAEPAYLPVEAVDLALTLQGGAAVPLHTTLLSPFDSLIWDRGRARALFGFDYRLEAYVPAAQRRYGYYSLVILHRGALVGRLDPKLDRKGRRLIIRDLHLEEDLVPGPELGPELARSMTDLALFLGAEHIELAPGGTAMGSELVVELRTHLDH